ncbi:MAG: hypothetical protein QM778_28675 [Myxococcales bacterium]
MNQSASFLLAAFVALAAQGCRPETPRPGDVCFPLTGTSQGNNSGCQKQVCTAAHQEVKRDVNQGSAGFVCEHCTGIPADKIASDTVYGGIVMKYESSDLYLELLFDNRASLDYSAANLEHWAIHAQGTFTTSAGTSRFFYEPFELVGYENGKLHVRLHPQLSGTAFSTIGDPKVFLFGGVPLVTLHQTCVYGLDYVDVPPPPPGATVYDLAIDLNLPVTMTAY